MNKRRRWISKKVIIILIVIAAVIVVGVVVFFILRKNSMFSFLNMPDFSAGSKLYESIANVFDKNSFEGTKLNPFENATNG